MLKRSTGLTWRWLLAGLALPAFLFLLAACGGGGEKEAAKESPAAGQTPTVTAPAGETPAATEGAADLQKLARTASGEITAKVTYSFKSTAAGQETEGTWTLTQRSPDTRMDFAGAQAEEAFTVIQAGGKSYVCTTGQCLSVPAQQSEQQTALFQPVLATTESLAEEDVDRFNLVETSERTIAGVRGQCFKVNSTLLTEFNEAEVCFSEEGVLLLSRTSSAQGEFSIEATDVTTDVTDDDFKPPFPVTELPGQ